MSSIFTKIINRELPGYIVAEDDNCIAFLDINPLAKGHTLCVPKKEVDDLFNLDDETYKNLQLFTKKVAKGLEKVVDCARIGVTVIGLEVPHAHIHLIPINSIYDMDFAQEKLKFSDEEFQEITGKIEKAVEL
ncbi:MAG: HIT family protein [Bacteroidales bacterium]|nr:HIT family protein [Bacteroidales bacterium]